MADTEPKTNGPVGKIMAIVLLIGAIFTVILKVDSVFAVVYRWFHAPPAYQARWIKSDSFGKEFTQSFVLNHPQCRGCTPDKAIPYSGTFKLSEQGSIYDVRQTDANNADWTANSLASKRLYNLLDSMTFQIERRSWGPSGSITYTAYYKKQINPCVARCDDFLTNPSDSSTIGQKFKALLK